MSLLTSPEIVTLVQALTLLVLLWYTIETMRIRRQAARQHLIGIRPLIAAMVETEDEGFRCFVRNLTSIVALDVHIVIYDARNKNFRSELGFDVGQDESEIAVRSAPKTEEDVLKQLDEGCNELLGYSDSSYVCVFFKDIEGGAYAIKTPFSFDEATRRTFMQRRILRRLLN
jgi:hypothetical protein